MKAIIEVARTRPTSPANRTMRSATTCACSTWRCDVLPLWGSQPPTCALPTTQPMSSTARRPHRPASSSVDPVSAAHHGHPSPDLAAVADPISAAASLVDSFFPDCAVAWLMKAPSCPHAAVVFPLPMLLRADCSSWLAC